MFFFFGKFNKPNDYFDKPSNKIECIRIFLKSLWDLNCQENFSPFLANVPILYS